MLRTATTLMSLTLSLSAAQAGEPPAVLLGVCTDTGGICARAGLAGVGTGLTYRFSAMVGTLSVVREPPDEWAGESGQVPIVLGLTAGVQGGEFAWPLFDVGLLAVPTASESAIAPGIAFGFGFAGRPSDRGFAGFVELRTQVSLVGGSVFAGPGLTVGIRGTRARPEPPPAAQQGQDTARAVPGDEATRPDAAIELTERIYQRRGWRPAGTAFKQDLEAVRRALDAGWVDKDILKASRQVAMPGRMLGATEGEPAADEP